MAGSSKQVREGGREGGREAGRPEEQSWPATATGWSKGDSGKVGRSVSALHSLSCALQSIALLLCARGRSWPFDVREYPHVMSHRRRQMAINFCGPGMMVTGVTAHA